MANLPYPAEWPMGRIWLSGKRTSSGLSVLATPPRMGDADYRAASRLLDPRERNGFRSEGARYAYRTTLDEGPSGIGSFSYVEDGFHQAVGVIGTIRSKAPEGWTQEGKRPRDFYFDIQETIAYQLGEHARARGSSLELIVDHAPLLPSSLDRAQKAGYLAIDPSLITYENGVPEAFLIKRVQGDFGDSLPGVYAHRLFGMLASTQADPALAKALTTISTQRFEGQKNYPLVSPVSLRDFSADKA